MASSLLVLMSISCGGSKPGAAPQPGEPGADGTAFVPPSTPVEPAADGGLAFTLEEVAGTAPSEAKVRTLEGTPLSAKESAALWSGVPALPVDKGDVVPFNKREGSAPPPTATVIAEQPFPPAPGQPAGAAEKRPLEVVRFAPEGEAQLVRELSVTFNQPMVPLTSHGNSVAGELPVKLSPMPKGQFRWIGTSTLLFTAEPRFPFATEYTVTVPQGAKSLSGMALGKEQSFRFQTPRLELLDITPAEEGETTPLAPLLFLSFNQKVDAQKLLAAVTLEAKGKQVALRLATPEEVAANDDVRGRVENLAGEGMREHGVVLRPMESLPYASKVVLTIPKGTAVGEGPRGTTAAITKTFTTHGPFSLKKVTCHGTCPPGGGVQIELTNPVDPEAFDESWLKLEPAVPFQVSPSGDSLYLTGETKAQTEYKITLAAAVRDTFGQTLGKEVTGSFKVGDASPELTNLPTLVLLDPKAPARTLSFDSVNVNELTVEVRRVEPKDYLAFAQARERMGEKNPPALPGKVVSTEKIALKARNERQTTNVDLSKGLTNGLGHVIVSVTPRPAQGPDFWLQRSVSWVQSTELGLDAFWDGAELVAWSTALSDGSPQKDVSVTLEPEGLRGTSDADGLARLKLPSGDGGRVRVLLAQRGADVAILPEHPYGAHGGGAWSAQQPGQGLRAHIFDDRGLYRPGETVHLKGWLRLARGQASIELPRGTVDGLSYEVTSQGGEVFAKGTAKLNDVGGFEASFALPKTVHLGQASVQFKTAGKQLGELWHGFQIEEYRRPEYEVSVKATSPVHFANEKLKLEATASYHAGGGLAEAKATWTVTSRSAHFTPPGREGFLFGEQPMFWERMWMPREQGRTETLTGRTDARGMHTIAVLPARAEPAFVHELDVSARVEDLSRQGFADQTTLLVHPAEVYVGLRSTQSFTREGETIAAEAIVTDLDGKAVSGRPVTLSLVELTGKFERGKYRSIETEVERCNVTSGSDVVKCELHAKRAGSYRIAARVTDAKQRPNDTHLRHWVSGESGGPMVSAQPGQLELIPDKKSYQPGETAHVMLRAPFAPAEALVRVTHERIVELRRVHLTAANATFDVKIGAEHVPNLQVLVEVVGRGTSEDGKQSMPARASGSLDLAVSLDARRLQVEVTPAARELEPGTKTRVKVVVRDAKGQPQKNADVALIVVDEAILQMLTREEPHPLEAMHPHVDPAGGSTQSRDYVLAPSTRPDVLEQAARNRAGGMRAMAEGGNLSMASPMLAMAADKAAGVAVGNAAEGPMKMRKLFEPLALFAGSLRTDGNGMAQADVTMPDTLTRYRVLGVAAAGDVNFGRGESSITARKLLMLRPAMARFINLGDELSVPVLVQNQGDEEVTVDVGVRAANFELTGTKDKRITVPAHDRVEVRFSGKSKKPGTVRLSFVAKAKGQSDGTELSLPAFTPATDEAFATYGDLASDGAIAQGLALPKDVSLLWGGLDVSLSSTEVAALTDALLSVLETPYEFPEQSASRILTVLATRDILAAFAAEGVPARAELDALMAREISRLAGLQRNDGGFGYYDVRSDADPFISVHVSHALARAAREKLQIPQSLSEPLRNYVRNLVALPTKDTSPEERATILAYAAYSERAWGANDAELAKQALAAAPIAKQPAEALGWLLPVLSAQQSGRVGELVRALGNRVTETAGRAEISSTGRDGRHVTLSSTKRETAVVLDALLTTNQAKDLAPKLARGLLAGRTRGRWEGTQENVFSLLALRTYFEAYERDVPAFQARAFLDATLAAEQRFQGRTTKQASTHVPMAWLAQHKSSKLTLEKRGQGRLYYRLALAYAPSNFVLPAADHGFVVERRYEAVDQPEDVQRDVQGAYRIRAGARVRVVVTMVAPGTRHHVALVDPLPAGLEAINPALAVSERLPDEPPLRGRPGRPGPIVPLMSRIGWFGPWFDHQNLRDERAEAHASQVNAGVYTYTYYARATTPGRYIAPPAKAEELYAPETFGRGESARVTVE